MVLIPYDARLFVDNEGLIWHVWFWTKIAAQIDGKRIGRIRMRKISNANSASLMSFVEDSVEPGSCVYTDGWSGYKKLTSLGYAHEVSVIGQKKKEATELLQQAMAVEPIPYRSIAMGIKSSRYTRKQPC